MDQVKKFAGGQLVLSKIKHVAGSIGAASPLTEMHRAERGFWMKSRDISLIVTTP